MELEKPDLYRLSEDGRSLVLRAGKCSVCNQVTFPLSGYGCPACGAGPDAVEETGLSGRAKLLSAATIYQKLAPGLEPPVTVGEAEIAPGIIEEIMLAVGEKNVSEGMTVAAIPVVIGEGEATRITCRFVPAEGAPWG